MKLIILLLQLLICRLFLVTLRSFVPPDEANGDKEVFKPSGDAEREAAEAEAAAASN